MEPDYIAKAAQIASVLEVSGHPKPGNVHRTQDFDDMVFEDFLISGVVIGDIMKQTAERGLKYREPENFHKIGLGKQIRDAVIETNKWVANNTNLGIIMLLTPICAAAAMNTDLKNTRENIDVLIRATTPEDAVNLYDAISIADAGGMGERDELDVGSSKAKDELIEKGLNMYDVLEISAGWDRLAYELTNKMPVTFDIGYPTFREVNPKTPSTMQLSRPSLPSSHATPTHSSRESTVKRLLGMYQMVQKNSLMLVESWQRMGWNRFEPSMGCSYPST